MSCRFAVALFCSLVATRVAAATIEIKDAKGDALPGVQVVVVDEGERKTLSAETDKSGIATVALDPGTRVSILCAHQDFKGWHKADVELVETQTIKLRPAKGWGSLVFTEAAGKIPGLEGQLTVINDQTRQLRLYSENMLVNGKRQMLVPTRLRKKTGITDMQKNVADIAVIGTAGSAILIDYSVRPFQAPKPASDRAEFVVTDRRGDPIVDADVVLVHVRNSTFVEAKTNELGEAILKDFPNEPVVVYCGQNSFRAFRDVLEKPYGSHKITLTEQNGIGSAVFRGYDNIPGFRGTLLFTADDAGRHGICWWHCSNMAVDGRKQRLVEVTFERPMTAIDAAGTRCQLVVLELKGEAALIEYQFP